VWFEWEAPDDGTAVFDTAGSTFDTLLAVYTGTSVDALEHIGSNDDDDELGWQSRVSFAAHRGVRYAIAVDGYLGATGDFAVNWRYD